MKIDPANERNAKPTVTASRAYTGKVEQLKNVANVRPTEYGGVPHKFLDAPAHIVVRDGNKDEILHTRVNSLYPDVVYSGGGGSIAIAMYADGTGDTLKTHKYTRVSMHGYKRSLCVCQAGRAGVFVFTSSRHEAIRLLEL